MESSIALNHSYGSPLSKQLFNSIVSPWNPLMPTTLLLSSIMISETDSNTLKRYLERCDVYFTFAKI
jgi:hypothetical protein